MHKNEQRLMRYSEAAKGWAAAWPGIQSETAGLPLAEAHSIVVSRAEGLLPFTP